MISIHTNLSVSSPIDQISRLDKMSTTNELSFPRGLQRILNDESITYNHSNPMALNHLLNPTTSTSSSDSFNCPYYPVNSQDSLNSTSDTSQDHEIYKRRYRRHPKPDPCAPRKPQTAYILFSNAIRRGGHYKHMSFTESAQLVAQIWRNLDQTNKNVYLDRAEKDRFIYRSAVAAYRLTPAYKEYKSYLSRFYNQDGQIVRSVGRPKKAYSNIDKHHN